jgi:hypothetical protein
MYCAGYYLMRSEGFSYGLKVLFKGLEIKNCAMFDQKKIIKSLLSTWIRISIDLKKCWLLIRIETNAD